MFAENWIRATVIYRVLRAAHLFSKRRGWKISKHVFVATPHTYPLSLPIPSSPLGVAGVKSAGQEMSTSWKQLRAVGYRERR